MDVRILAAFFLLATAAMAAEVEDLALPLATAEITVLAPNQTVRLILDKDPDPSMTFWAFEAHSYDNDDRLIMSKTQDLNVSKPAYGPKDVFHVKNHPGVIVFSTDLAANQTIPYAFLTNAASSNVSVLLIVRGYTAKHPVPGYVNATTAFSGLQVKYDMNSIFVEFYPAYVANTSLNKDGSGSPILTYAVYQHYLAERSFDEEKFLSQLSNTMLRLDDIVSRGNLVDDVFVMRNVTPAEANRVMFSAYPGTAVIFSVVVTTIYPDDDGSNHEFSSVYVTSSTFACQLDGNQALNCKVMWYTITKVICGISVFVGIFLAFFGHRYYLFSQFFFGAYGTGVCAFIVIAVLHHGILVGYTEQVGLCIAIGIIGKDGASC